jgi:hypothetical protein
VSRIVGRYELLDRLGEGGMADVYLARQLDLDRLVALKELRALAGADPSFAKRFLREARMAGSLSHPNIVTVHDYIENEGTPFIAMEYMERGSLRPHIGQISLAQVGGVLEGVLAGLAYAGERGIVHRDIKPENVMIGADGRVKIADFGIAKARDAFQSQSLTAEGTALGTPNYMAPEQASADEVGTWTDIYAVGVVAFEMFVGRPPFADTPSPLVVLMRQVQDPVPRVTDFDPRIDPRIADWIAWLTAKPPPDRPQSAAEAWDGFEEILVGSLGARWQRAARLLPGVAAGAALAAAPTAAAAVPATAQIPGATPTRPLADPRLAPTVAPNLDLLGIDRTEALGGPGTAAPTRLTDAELSRRRKRRLAAGVAAALLVAVFALGALRHDSGPARAAQDAAPAKPAKSPPATTAQPTQAVNEPAGVAADRGMSKEAADARRLARQYNAAAAKIEALSATGAQAGQNAILANLTRKVARAYSNAARAAARGDVAGYTAALADATSAKNELDQSARAPAPAASSSGGETAAPVDGSASACAGDSTSDDPSDDSCGGEP